MELRLLGPLEVDDAGRTVALGARKERALLAVLALHANTTVSEDALIAALWGDHPPRTAAKTLHSSISRLRRALQDTEMTIGTQAGGYRLEIAADALDVTRVEALAVQARAALADDRPDEAAVLLGQALRCWRGQPLGEFAAEAWAMVECSRLTELRHVLLELHIDAELACGRHAALLPELDALTTSFPLRERFWAQRMLALYRAGRQADALRVYQDLRQILTDELGIDPSPELRALEGSILAQSADLEWVRHDGSPVRARGPAPPARVPLPAVLATPPTAGFHGRAAERARILEQFSVACDGRLAAVLIAGEPGIGKTALVGDVARAAFADGATVLYGRCHEDMVVPFQPWVEALEYLLQHGPRGLRDELGGTQLTDLGRMIPSLAARGTDGSDASASSSPDTERYRLFAAVVAALEVASRDAPVVLVLDDLHWADRPTLQLLRHLAGSMGPLSLLVLATHRDTELVGGHPLVETLAMLRREPNVSRVRLEGLGSSELTEMVAHAVGRDRERSDIELVQALRRETQGNPFFCLELLQHLAETGVLAPAGASTGSVPRLDRIDLPDSVREVIGARVDRLGDDISHVLELAAVIGPDF
jgi:DNA-binding SARP family transcriptional activator